jgi:hypothetical protein
MTFSFRGKDLRGDLFLPPCTDMHSVTFPSCQLHGRTSVKRSSCCNGKEALFQL